jgi:phosphoglycerol transferase MdoB-like AlkP superfamily enzyme
VQFFQRTNSTVDFSNDFLHVIRSAAPNYSIYDAVESAQASAQRVLADSTDITEVVNYTKSNYAEPN